jgi:pimeloyl-ACP methyl ester carboxylesterase
MLAAAGLAWGAPAHAAMSFERCGDAGFSCARLSVPLDRWGLTPGQVSLFVSRMKAEQGPARGATFLLAGGPGQSASEAFRGDALGPFGAAGRTRDLIVYDQRGTGHSGVLRCPRLERASLLDAGAAAAECAAELGPRRAFYTTRDSVEDMEAIRRELGYDKIAIYGASYGTKVALAYALAHPGHVERLVLDSVVEPEGPDPLYRDTFAAVPRELRSLCRIGCRHVSRDPVGDLERLVARLARGPLRGTVVTPKGRRRPGSLSRSELFLILLAGDFDPGLRAAFPAAVHAALTGDPALLLRLKRRAIEIDAEPPPARVLSAGLYAATTCEESALPWARSTPFGERTGLARAAVAAAPALSFRPFDKLTALDSDVLALCERWPAAGATPALGPGPLPDVPVLLLEGEDDLRTPVEGAREVAARFPQARLLVASETGHSVLGNDLTGCADRAFGRFFEGGLMPSRCPRGRRIVPPAPLPPRSLRALKPLRPVHGSRGRALRALALTMGDVANDTLSNFVVDLPHADLAHGGGLRGGAYRLTARGALVLRRVSFVPGVRVSGRIQDFLGGDQRGALRLAGRGPDGRLGLRGNLMTGRLGGRRVRARLPLDPFVASARAARASSAPPVARASGARL